jgi:hypothetical protein
MRAVLEAVQPTVGAVVVANSLVVEGIVVGCMKMLITPEEELCLYLMKHCGRVEMAQIKAQKQPVELLVLVLVTPILVKGTSPLS